MNGSNGCWAQPQDGKRQNRGKSTTAGMTLGTEAGAVATTINTLLTVNKDTGKYTEDELKNHFESLIDGNTVLGSDPSPGQTDYVDTPILTELKHCIRNDVVSVAVVPPGLGKTTAARSLLEGCADEVKGLAFCFGGTEQIPFNELMFARLNLKAENIPNDWLKCLMQAFFDSGDERRKFLIIEEISTENLTDENKLFIQHISNLARGKKVSVIALTCTSKCGRSLLSPTSRVVPLNRTYNPSLRQWKSMYWSTKTVKEAAVRKPSLKNIQFERIYSEVDKYVKSLPRGKRGKLDPLSVFAMLEEKLLIPQAPVRGDNRRLPDSGLFCAGCFWF